MTQLDTRWPLPVRALFRLVLAGALAAGLVGSAGAAEPTPAGKTATAIFSGGCFWCVEADFEKLRGVVDVVSGYTGGTIANPTYEQVGHGGSGHIESVRVEYDPKTVSYEQLLDYFWHHVDPTVKDQQFCDHGPQYRTAIFYQNDTEKAAAEASKAALLKSGRVKEIYTEIRPAMPFYLAEDYHQDYYKKNPLRYRYYRTACGRDARVAEVWGDHN